MGRLKTLWSIGVILGLSAPAVAADFSPPPPPPPGPIVSELGSGWYLRGDVGWVEFSDPGKLPLGAGLPFDRVGLRETWSVGGGFGYQINSWFRTDVTADWRNDAKFFGVNSGSNYVNGYSIDNGKIESSTLLLNGYIDFGRWYGFTPYVGAGVGVAQNHFHSYAGQVTCLTLACGPLGPQLATPIPSHTTYNLAWAAHGRRRLRPRLRLQARCRLSLRACRRRAHRGRFVRRRQQGQGARRAGGQARRPLRHRLTAAAAAAIEGGASAPPFS